jgi:imidazolonepropionase-like amidohydrolase
VATITRDFGRAALAAACMVSATFAGDHPFESDALRKPAFKTGGTCVIRNVVIHSAVAPAFNGDVYVKDGDIAAVGQVSAPAGTMEIDGRGMHLTPGVIDNHSHMAISRGVNEGTYSITGECDISDAVDSEDVSIWRALAGGVTGARLLHGSANTIGGRHEVIKLKYGRTVDELINKDAKEGIKFALGENVKRSNGGGNSSRFPATRMGVEALLVRAFTRAQEYQREWADYEAARARGEDVASPRRDIRLDVLAGILDRKIDVHSHCYRADEILMLLRTAESYGFRVKTLQHVLEGYKVAHEIAQHGAGPSTFSDWWAYKIEAYDAIPFNAAMLTEAGAVTTINSDSDELVRHLFSDAGKSQRYGGLDAVRALQLVTLNSARQLAIDNRTGSIEVGKDADLALHTSDPLSSYSRVEWTMVDGEMEFTRRDAFELDTRPATVSEITEPRTEPDAAWSSSGPPAIAIVGGTLHPVTSPDIARGTIVLQGGRIVAMGAGLAVPANARVIDATGKHVWPGMIALDTNVGLYEIGSVQATIDTSEIGGNQPDVRSSASISAESAHIAVTRYNGVTRVQTSPQGGGPLMGQSCVIRLTGDTWEELLHVDRDMLHIAFPNVGNLAKEKKEPDSVKEMKKLFTEARTYARLLEDSKSKGAEKPAYDPRLEALAPYVSGTRKVAVRASNAQTLLHALKFIEEEKLDAVIVGAAEGWKVADALAAAKVPVVVGGTLRLPSSDYDPYDAAYANPAVLHRAGVPFAIGAGDDENVRNVGFHAAMAASFGLPREEALRSVTIYAARTLGLERELGSLARGKVADVVITDGDLLDTRTQVEAVFIDGVQQSMHNRQTALYEKYDARLSRKKAASN